MGAINILLIEDDTDIAELVTIYLKHAGFQPSVASNGEIALQMLAQYDYQLIICDIILPDREGTEIIRSFREYSTTPVIFLSSKKESEDILNGFQLGGDDYITKPFDPDILVARVNAQLRRSTPTPHSNMWTDGQLELHFRSLEVKLNGHEVPLSTKERQLLFHLAQYPNQVFTTDQLYDRIWGLEGMSDTRTVMVHIHHLRKKLERGQSRYIVTVRGIGYKFNSSTDELNF
ncbi:response regulator transcription factor [Halalkalibacter hemicellulosilyticus]|uniref:Two component transcriptional regulator n=1 Tax=Halalkalibacter hemicellulosilyticusJCM 9152 TaxID=1236971 RepID=W4QAN5_9BACI|nr:response regulator transcription factor [Halalkalibacter hemicellulosilyticus]GAE28748.1 two component transcriptional regulator [Halalkalibacter hemicellulosilyticusJCM 9152]